jgi:hypothetical protein
MPTNQPSHQPGEASAHYTFTDGKYAFRAFGRELCSDLPTVALLFDHRHNVVINHGNPAFARKRFAAVQRMYIDSGLASDDVVLLEGQFPVDELNAVISIPGKIGEMYAKIQHLNSLRALEVVEALLSRITVGFSVATVR